MLKRQKYLDDREIAILRANSMSRARSGSLSHVVDNLVVDVALSTGLRVGEIACLRYGDFDFTQQTIRVIRLKKGGDFEDRLPLSDRLSLHVREYASQLQSRGVSVDSLSPNMFASKRGGSLSRRGLQYAWGRCVKAAGLPNGVSIHGARHSLATSVYRRTKDINLTSCILGHSSISITAKYYAHVPWEDMVGALT